MEAVTISPAWIVRNHEPCNSTGKFLAVNGDTGETGVQRKVWSQTVTVEPETAYRFCAYFRNLSTCPLDVKPTIGLRFNGSPDPDGLSVIDTEPTTACDWDRVSRRIVIPVGVVSFTAEIWLDESVTGDGNDLAIDGISLRRDTPELP